MGDHCLSAESRMLAKTTSPSWQTLTQRPYMLTPATSTSSFIFTVILISTDVVPGPSLQPSSTVDKEPNYAFPTTMAAIIGGIVVGVTLLALLLTSIVVRSRRRKQKLSVTPFNLLSTAEPPRIEPRGWLELRSTNNLAVPTRSRPSGRGPSIIQLEDSDSCLARDSRDGSPFAPPRVDPVSFQLPNDTDASASTVARRQRSYELEKLYPSRAHASDRYRHDSGDNRVEHMVADDCSREPSEELPAYPRSMESLKSRDVDHDDHDVFS